MRSDDPYRFLLGILFIAVSIAAFWAPIRHSWPVAGRMSSFIFGAIWALMGLRIVVILLKRQ